MTAAIRIMLAIPTAGTVPAMFAYSLAGLIARFASHKVPTVPEAEISLMLRVLESSNWITNREKLARMAVDEDFTHLMFLDDDMEFDPRVLECMLGRRQDIVTTNYLIKTIPAKDFVAVDLQDRRIHTTADSTGIVPIAYSGFGASIISTKALAKIPQPWFLPDFNLARSEYTTEDNPFFRRAREAGFTVYLDQDASKYLGHIGRKTWTWDEVKNG